MYFNSGFLTSCEKGWLLCALTKEYRQNFQYIHMGTTISIRSTQEIIDKYESGRDLCKYSFSFYYLKISHRTFLHIYLCTLYCITEYRFCLAGRLFIDTDIHNVVLWSALENYRGCFVTLISKHKHPV